MQELNIPLLIITLIVMVGTAYLIFKKYKE